MELTEEQIERAQIEAVFCLGGGELNDGPWEETGARYWYDGPPEWCASDYPDRWDREYVTVISCELYGRAEAPEGWSRVAAWVSSGEAGCLWNDAHLETGETVCPYCGAALEPDELDPGWALHAADGYVYIGDGWCEVLMARDEEEEGEEA